MNKIGKLVVVKLGFIGALLSCSNKNDLKELRITYAPQYVNINVPATCYSFEFELIDVKRKKVTDDDFLNEIAREVQALKTDNDDNFSTKSVDVRVRCILDYGNKADTLCLGEFSGIIFNGELMEDSQTLLELLKSNIYIK